MLPDLQQLCVICQRRVHPGPCWARVVLMLFALPLLAQQQVPVHVVVDNPVVTPVSIPLHLSAIPQDPHSTSIAFGKLGNYIAVSVDLCEAKPQAAKIPLARIRQAVTLPAGYTLLSTALAASVVQDAQGKAPLAATARIMSGVASGTAEAIAIKKIPTNWVSTGVLIIQGTAILVGTIFPALQTHAVLTVGTQMLPEMLDFETASGGCVSGMVLVQGPKGAKSVGGLNQDITVLASAAQ